MPVAILVAIPVAILVAIPVAIPVVILVVILVAILVAILQDSKREMFCVDNISRTVYVTYKAMGISHCREFSG